MKLEPLSFEFNNIEDFRNKLKRVQYLIEQLDKELESLGNTKVLLHPTSEN
jgi:hypothetical protein